MLSDGIPLIVLDIPQLRIPPRAVEGLRARVRNKGSVLMVSHPGEWLRQPELRIAAAPVAAEGMGQGYGRIRRLVVEVRVFVRERPFRRGRLVLDATTNGHTGWTALAPAAASALRSVHVQAG